MGRYNSLKNRMARNYMIIIFISVFVTEFATMLLLQEYFYNNIRTTLENQLRISADFYERYFSDQSLEDNVYGDVDAFWKQTDAEVQIINLDSVVILDSQGTRPKGPREEKDIAAALSGGTDYLIFSKEGTGQKVMAVSYPLKDGNGIVGALRFITSMRDVDRTLRVIALNFSLFAIGVVLITAVISQFLSKKIIKPIEELTATAEEISSGNYNVVSRKYNDDEVGKLSDAFNYMTREIKKKDALKNDFISSVSHELRTPLTAIKGWAITLKDESTDRELLSDGLDIISNETDRLKNMVEELLDFSKFVSGKITLDLEKVDITRLFDFIWKNMEDRANREGKRFIVNRKDNMGFITADANRLKQVFINLIDNAFKFTGPGGEITVSMEKTDRHIDFIVADNGIGIGSEDIDKVKEKFFKGKTSNSSNGIGLSICDEIAKLHGGELVINSELGTGTEIRLRIPTKGVVTHEKTN